MKPKPRLRLHTDGTFDIWAWGVGPWKPCGFFYYGRMFILRLHDGSYIEKKPRELLQRV